MGAATRADRCHLTRPDRTLTGAKTAEPRSADVDVNGGYFCDSRWWVSSYFAGSTRYSGARGLVDVELRRNFPIPHAWQGQRLVKVDPTLPHSAFEWYPNASTPIEQWQLVVPVDAEIICSLAIDQVYWLRP